MGDKDILNKEYRDDDPDVWEHVYKTAYTCQ